MIKELTWQALEAEFRIRTKNGVKENELAEAIQAGEILALLQKCADELHNGDFTSVVRAFRRNLSSVKCNKVKNDSFRSVDRERYALLEAYTAQFVEKVSTNKFGKAKVNFNRDDIMTLEGNYEELRKLYNVFADRKSKSPDKITDMVEFKDNFELIKRLKAEAKKAESAVTEDILVRLKEGKKLTKAQTEELLNKLTK